MLPCRSFASSGKQAWIDVSLTVEQSRLERIASTNGLLMFDILYAFVAHVDERLNASDYQSADTNDECHTVNPHIRQDEICPRVCTN